MNKEFFRDVDYLLEQTADSFLIECLQIFINEKRNFLQRKVIWCNNNNIDGENLYKPIISVLDNVYNSLSRDLSFKTHNKSRLNICRNFKRICEEKNLSLESLSLNSYFTLEELQNISDGYGYIYDSTDLEHLLEIIGCSEIGELTNYADNNN